jgi:hypothetical protein
MGKDGEREDQYFHDFELINNDLNYVKDYIIDLKFRGHNIQKLKDELWFSYNLDKDELATIEGTKKRSLDTKDDKKTTKRTKASMGTRVTVGSGKKKTKKKKDGATKRKREKSKSIDSKPSDPDLKLIIKQKRDKAARHIQNIMRARLKADKRRKFTKRRFGIHQKPKTHRESKRRFLDRQRYLHNIDDLDEYRANMRQYYFPEKPTDRYINQEYDFYGDMDDNNSNLLRDRLRKISIDDLFDDIF